MFIVLLEGGGRGGRPTGTSTIALWSGAVDRFSRSALPSSGKSKSVSQRVGVGFGWAGQLRSSAIFWARKGQLPHASSDNLWNRMMKERKGSKPTYPNIGSSCDSVPWSGPHSMPFQSTLFHESHLESVLVICLYDILMDTSGKHCDY